MGGRGGAFKPARGAEAGDPRREVAEVCVAMPGRPDDYEVLLTIGAGSYGKCRKVRRKADGKVRQWGLRDRNGAVAVGLSRMLAAL